MATVFDVGLLSEFSDIFAWVLIFVVTYGVLQITDIFKNRGIHALAAMAITVLVGASGNTTGVIAGLTPWFVITGFFFVFLIVLVRFMGVNIQETFIGGPGGMWWVAVPLLIGLIIALVGGPFSAGEPEIDSETGEEIITPGRNVLNIITEPKVLGLILILAISSVTIAIMAGKVS